MSGPKDREPVGAGRLAGVRPGSFAAIAALAAALLGAFALSSCRPRDGAVHPDVAKAVEKTRRAHPELFRRKVVVLGFDGCDPDLVEQYVREGKLPNFARLHREGAHAALKSVQPILSPVVWTTIATGMPPPRHGILDFVTEDTVPVDATMRQADTVWELLSQQGEKVGVVGWLVTWPAEEVNGFIVTDRMGQLAFEFLFEPPKGDGRKTWPESLEAEMRDDIVSVDDITYAKVRPFLEISEEEFRATRSTKFDPRNLVGNLRLVLKTAETFRNAGERLYKEHRPRFFACYFEAMDAISHFFMPYAPPKAPHIPVELYLKYRSAMEANYVWHDRVLGEFMDACDADTTLFVVSDHGFKHSDFRLEDASDFHARTGAMWHRPYGVFYAWGSGVKAGRTVAGASVFEIAPTILACMGYPVPDDMGGRVLTEVFADGLEYETVPTYRGEARREEMAKLKVEEGGEPRPQSPEEQENIERMRALGYIAGNRSDPAATTLNLGSSLLSQGRVQRAYQEFKKLLEKQRLEKQVTHLTLMSITEACFQTGRLDEAEGYIAEMFARIEADQRNPQVAPEDFALRRFNALLFRSRALTARKKFREAETAARQALEMKEDMPHAWQILGFALQGLLEDAEKSGDRSANLRAHGAIIEAYERALRLEPKQAPLLADLAQLRLATAKWVEDESTVVADAKKARDELDRALELNPVHISGLNNRGIALLRIALHAQKAGRAVEAEKHLAEALDSVERAIELAAERWGPNHYDKGWANKAYVLWKMGRLPDAFAAAQKAREINPSYVLAPAFVADMRRKGHALPDPAPAPAPEKQPAGNPEKEPAAPERASPPTPDRQPGK